MFTLIFGAMAQMKIRLDFSFPQSFTTHQIATEGESLILNFEKEKDFIGDVSVSNMRCSTEEFFVAVRNIRRQLGKQAYLLDKYLLYLMEAENRTLAYEPGVEGFDRFSELREMCGDIIRGEKKNTGHLFYKLAEDFIGTNPLSCMEIQTKIALYTVMLSGYYLEFMATEFYRSQQSGLSDVLDMTDFRQLHGRICELLGGDEDMGHIDRLFRRCFLAVTPMACYLQGMANGLLYELTMRDSESSKLVFQLLLDRMP